MSNRKLNDTSMVIEQVTHATLVTSIPWIFPLYVIVGGLFKDPITKQLLKLSRRISAEICCRI